MQKTYWWRGLVILVCAVALVFSYAGSCDFRISKCLGGNSILLTRTLVHFSLAILPITLLTLFVNDLVFKKWLRFTLIWFTVTFIFVMLAPEYKGGWGPNYVMTKEMTSIWMSSLFVIISPIRLFLAYRRSKKEF